MNSKLKKRVLESVFDEKMQRYVYHGDSKLIIGSHRHWGRPTRQERGY